MKHLNRISTILIVCVLVLIACNPAAAETQPPAPTATVVPTPTPRPEKNVSLNKPVKVSASWVVDPPERAVNGNADDWWGAGGPAPAWIEVDLQGIYVVSRINLVEGPTGLATYQVFGRGPDGVNHPLHTFEVRNSQYQTLKFSPEAPLEGISTIRIEISDSGSGWVGIREIQVFSRDEPKPLPESDKDKTPLFLREVHTDELMPITPENAIFVEQLAVLGRGPVNDIAWSPDGTTLAVASPLGVWLYDPNDLKSDPLLLEGHTRDVLSVIFSLDGKMVLSGSQDGTVKQWDALTGVLKRTISLWNDFSYEVGSAPREKEVWSIAFSPDGKMLASGAYDGSLRLWDLATGGQKAALKGHTRQISALTFSADSTLLASNSLDGAIFIWDVATGSQRVALTAQTSEQRLAFSPDAKTLAIAYGTADKPVQLYDTVSGEKITELTEHKAVLSLAFHQKGLITSGLEGKLKLWNAESGTSQVINDKAGWITDLAISPDGATLASNEWHGVLQLWDIAAGTSTEALIVHTGPVTSIAFSPDGMSVASGSEAGFIWVWKVKSNTLDKAMFGHVGRVTDVAFSPDGKLLASSGFDRTVRLWDAASAKQIAVLSGHESFVRCVAFSPDGKWIASGSTDKTVRLWEVETGKEHTILSGHTGEIQDVTFSTDGVWLLSASVDKTLRVWEVATGEERGVLQGNLSSALSAAFSPDGALIASVGGDHSLRVFDWEIASGKAISKDHFPSIGHPGWVLSVTFSPDGKLIASANLSSTSFWVTPGEVHLYLADTGYPYALLRGHTKRVTSIAFSPDGKLLASGSADGSVRLWGTPFEGPESESQPVTDSTTTNPTPTPKPVDKNPFVGEWTATDPHDGSNMTLTIQQSDGGDYSITLIDDGSTGCGGGGKPKVGIEIVFKATVIGSTLYATSTSATCLSTPPSLLDVKINQNFLYKEATDTLWDDANRVDWKRSPSSSWRDDFDGSLADGWYWIREDRDRWNLMDTTGFLRIYISPYEPDGKTQNRLLRRITVKDFMITTHVIFEPTANFQFAGLTIYQDDDNTISFGRAFCNTPNICVGNGIYFDNVIDGNWTGNNFATSVSTLNEAYLRLERRDNVVKAFFSYDGESWTEIGSHTLKSGFLVTGVGLIASGDHDKSDADIPADFDFFELSALP